MSKRIVFVVAGAVAALSPIVLFSTTGWWSGITMSLTPGRSTESPSPWEGSATEAWQEGVEGGPVEPVPRRRHDPTVHELADVLRFDATPDWIVSRWARVSTGLAHLQLQGYRVPLVTGTAQDDLAGALTYYFNPRQQLQRITFHGTTGNSRKLVGLMTARFGFVRRMVNHAGVFLYEVPDSSGKATSFLWIRPARVVKASEPYRRFEVAFLIERPEKRP